MKKSLIMTLAATMSLALLAGCGASGTTEGAKGSAAPKSTDTGKPAEKIKLSLWHNYTGEDLRAKKMREYMEKFKKDHPNVELDIQGIPPDGYRARLKTVAAANEMPDLFVMQPGVLTKELVAGGLIQPVNELLDSKPEWKNGFMPGSFNDFTIDGKIYSAPMALSPTSILFYNKEIFNKYNVQPPKTWDDLMKLVETFKKNNLTPIALGNKAAWVAQSSILSSLADRVTGTEWFLKAVDQNGAKFTDPEFVQALTYLQQLGKAGAFQEGFNSIDNTQMEQMFAQGKSAMMIDGGWALPNLAANTSKEALANMAVTVLPSVPNGKGDPNSLSGVVGTGIGLSKKVAGAQKATAYELIYALSGPDAQKAILESNQLVSYKVDLDTTKVSSLFVEVYKLMGTVKRTPVYDGNLSSSGADVVNNGLQELLMGGKPEDIAKKIQDAQAKAVGK
ncbi:ABC transporter substrate-binding protein [Paenibacillus ferrarius]|uniref:ABC transporter substrate-binding protein n=1 Tax=Paenibacillus ferrarius TaxID=1469647 RepID=A0A1V4HA61_9BACL|nr:MULTISPECIES: extracellular solute-binding protein [Paenibacillus]NQX70995.1 extracellular solute-binding protein [Paenibacillus alba]OPH48265.1 ABC transporter substrate-binding protein [Paenibacillus ferrarius]